MYCCYAYSGGFPVVLDNLWLGGEESQAVASALVPKLQKTKTAVEQLLFEVATLEVRYAVSVKAYAAASSSLAADSRQGAHGMLAAIKTTHADIISYTSVL